MSYGYGNGWKSTTRTLSCGHVRTLSSQGGRKQVESWADWKAASEVCGDCRKAEDAAYDLKVLTGIDVEVGNTVELLRYVKHEMKLKRSAGKTPAELLNAKLVDVCV